MTKIVGQEEALNSLDKLFKIFTVSQGAIKPHFFLTGESGSGKTILIKHLCSVNKLNYLEINAAGLTKEGTSGNSLSKALSPLLQYGNKMTVVFVDEFDKMFISGNSNSSTAHETTTGVQNEFLKVLEGNTATVFGDYGKYLNVSTEKVLFVFAGAFNNEPNINITRLRELGVKTEFLGRVGLIFNTRKLSLEELYAVIDESELLDLYIKLSPNKDREEVALIIKAFVRDNYEFNTLGARLINTLIHTYFITGSLSQTQVQQNTFTKTLNL